MKTLVFIVLIIMAWRGIAMGNSLADKKAVDTTPAWLQEWHLEFEEEDRLQREALQKELHSRDPREEGREELA
ncbi:MAG: hypothetical protein DRJ03_01880 [Chloroflexi bacterium]|nr:MAG: hypothetical protein DRJ03_01880 [Chloroflexota bacterium]